MSRALNNSCRAGRIWKNTSTCASPTSCQTCQLMWVFMQQSSSYRSPVLKKGNTCGCQPVITVREPVFSQCSFSSRSQINEGCFLRNVESWASLSLADTSDLVLGRLFCCCVATGNHVTRSASEEEWAGHWTSFVVPEEYKHLLVQCLASLANWCGVHAEIQFISITSTEERADLPVGRALATLVTLVADAAVFTASRNPVATRNHVACCSSEQEWAEHWTTLAVPEEYGRTQAPVLAQRLARPANWCGCSCSNPVRIDHQYWRKGPHAGVTQWPLWDNHSLAKFHPRKGSDQWRVSPSECWKLRLVELGRHLRLVWRRFLGFWCCFVTVSRNPVATGNRFRARLSRALNIFCRAGRRQAPVVGVHAAIQFISITSTEERADLPVGRALATLVALVADAAGFTASRNLVATRNHVACCSSEQEWAEHWTTFAVPEEYGRIQAPVLAQRLARPANWCGCSCSNPVRIDHQYWRKGTHAGVSQWSLWDNHSLAKFHPRKGSDQWRVSPSECWKLRLVELGRHLRLVWRRFLGFWCCFVTVSRNPVATGNHVACSASEQEWAEHWTSFVVPEEYKHLC